MKITNLASYLDFGYHHPDATQERIIDVCQATIEYQLNSVFVNPFYVPLVKKTLNGQRKTGTVISFPLGQETDALKRAALHELLRMGADEFDVVVNIAYIKEHRWDDCLNEMKEFADIIHSFDQNKIIKCIPETGFLTDDEIKKMAELMIKAEVDFFKTCSGYGPRGATIKDVELIRAAVGEQIKIKVAGGITTHHQAVKFIQAGANRIGTSRAVEIVTQGKVAFNKNSSGGE